MPGLLASGEGPAVEVREGRGPLVFVCEHAANRLPASLGDLGLAPSDLQRHIAWDPGAQPVATKLALALGGDLIAQRFSRLVIDCNRDPVLPDAITALSETTPIPGNAGLTPAARQLRIDEVWTPFHDAVAARLDARQAARRATALVTIHTFNPVYRGVSRPWHVGIISTEDRSFADAMLMALGREEGLVVGDNEPYSPKDNVDYTIRRHGLNRGLPHVMIEIRNDLVMDEAGQAEWAERLADALTLFKVAERAA